MPSYQCKSCEVGWPHTSRYVHCLACGERCWKAYGPPSENEVLFEAYYKGREDRRLAELEAIPNGPEVEEQVSSD